MLAPNWVGDAVMSLGAVAELRAAGARTIVLARERVARVYAGLDAVDELVVLRARGRIARVVEGARAFDALRPRAAALLPPSLGAAAMAWLGGVPARVGYRCDARAPLLTRALDAATLRDEHVDDNARRVAREALRAAGLDPVPSPPPAPAARIGRGERARARALLAGEGVDGPYVVVAPGATFGPAKTWPQDRFAELARRLAAGGAVVLAGGPGDVERCRRVAEAAGAGAVLAGRTDLGTALALFEGASAVVANDSGAAHLAAWVGAPVAVIFGSTSPVWTAPRGERVRVVRHPVPCSPCFRRTCPTRLECFAGVSVDAVERAVREIARAGAPRENPLARRAPSG